ncbi:Serine/threonine exchanger SteT [Planctomycetes bacterium Poly30]|uniref:Serine/threonine exchanger SteT n=1 Tax=Saltatorellus ferox TaxID=2528018 RepID=A0A518EQY4_9BACT|nr:Serine/threonine exchanger SteT [Planctomycetes bacterium Poly30]
MSQAPRQLSLFDATMLVMGGIIGIGIFFNPASIARAVPSEGAYLLMWGLGTVAALSGAMTFAELSASFPRTGGWYVWLREAFGGMTAFLFAWVVLLVVSTGACALVARFMGEQISALFGGGLRVEVGSAALAVVGVTALALSGLKSSALFQNLCMLAKLGAVFTFVIGGLALFADPPAAVEVAAVDRTSKTLGGGMLAASLSVLFSFGGWQLLSYIAPSVKDPQKNLPRAIVIGVAAVAGIYFLVNLAYLRVLGLGGLAVSDTEEVGSMAVRMAEAILGASHGATFVNAAIAVSALGFLVATLITTPGIYVAMAREGLFVKAFGRVHPTTGAPALALLTQCGLVLAYLAYSLFDQTAIGTLTKAVVFAEWIFHCLAGLALIVLVRRGTADRPFKSPLYPLFPVTYALIAAAVVIGNLFATTRSEPAVTLLGVLVLALGAATYVPWSRSVSRR